MRDELLLQMRDLRQRVKSLCSTVAANYTSFYDRDKNTFFRLPPKPLVDQDSIGVTVTATALMALALPGKLEDVLVTDTSEKLEDRVHSCICRIFDHSWSTADLVQNNAFTTSLVLRAISILFLKGHITEEQLKNLKRNYPDVENNSQQTPTEDYRKFKDKLLFEIVKYVISGAPESFRVQEYLPTPSIAYWLIDGALNLSVDLDLESWKKVAGWISVEFLQQVSLITANHPALMDPIAMAMAATACKRLSKDVGGVKELDHFPSEEELRHGIRLFFDRQNNAGTWEKYFPLFHYPTSGSNHCWHFEVLEAILQEFSFVVDDPRMLNCLDLSVSWLERNRLIWQRNKEKFCGWNSGGQLQTLSRGEPESWATGVVHMFLVRLANSLSLAIRQIILKKYDVTTPLVRNRKRWDEAIDSKISVKGRDDEVGIKKMGVTLILSKHSKIR
jgi:hypothetical protein